MEIELEDLTPRDMLDPITMASVKGDASTRKDGGFGQESGSSPTKYQHNESFRVDTSDRLQAVPRVTPCKPGYALNSITPTFVRPSRKGRKSD